jgi:hypothetical protein
MNPTISTSPPDASCTTAGSSPFILSKSNSSSGAIRHFLLGKTKSPLSVIRVSGPKLLKNAVCIKSAISGAPPPTRYARGDDGGDGNETTYKKRLRLALDLVNQF